MNNIQPSLKSKIDEFLPTVRAGIDFGEYAGGIAVVKDSEILHAETYIDFHKATLEDRRTLRRGRRTRRAKRMRLARLRSWVLRQEIPATIPGAEHKNGKARLPDPYTVLNDRRFWVQPAMYQQKGKEPRETPSWIDLAKKGHVDAEGFVRALTLIFKKRGYKYDNKEVEELSDDRLLEFLDSCCRLQDAEEMAIVLEEEVSRRNKPKLQEAYKKALTREPEPRKALPRQIKEHELREIISAFGKRYNLDNQIVARWIRELIGEKDSSGKSHYGLLNKFVRQARFDNRLRSGCSWCGKKTPRLSKAKVRETAFRAAVENLRVYENTFSRRTRRLTEQEKLPFLNWWQKRQQAKEGKYDFPKGAKVPVTDRAPSEDNITKYLESIRAERRWMQNAKGKEKLGFPMLPQLNDFLNRVPRRGRASLCLEHLNMAAEGKLMKDAGVDWQTIAVRKAPNPAREQRDARVLHRLEQILFVKGKRGEEAWRYGPVRFISLEVPEPQTQKPKPREVPERKPDSFKDRLLKELDGRCAYCDAAATRKDHIFPKSRGGPDLWDNQVAACDNCNDQKGNLTPFEWLGSDALRWNSFKRHVETLPLSPRKIQNLLNETDEMPGGDPTPFARVGARPRQFIIALHELFESYGLPPPDSNYLTDKPHVQRIEGTLTAKLRESWLVKSDGSQNFPQKNPWDLYNHAQDAALIAASPPHTWRDRIFVQDGERPGRDGNMVMKPGLAVPLLAPDWAGFMRRQKKPMLRVLGRYPVSWRRSLFIETLWQEPENIEAKKGIVYKPIKQLPVSVILKGGKNEGIVSPFYRDRLQQLAKRLGLEKLDSEKQKRQTIPEEELKQAFPGVRHIKVFRQKVSGVWIPIKPKDGPPRKMMAAPESASEGAVYWLQHKGNREILGISIIRPRPLQRFRIPRLDPPIPIDAKRLGAWRRNVIIWLDSDPKEGYPEGWYRLKEFSDADVKLLPENAMPTEIAKRIQLKKGATDEELNPFKERKLGKAEILKYWLKQLGPQPN